MNEQVIYTQELEQMISLGESLNRLMKNRDFKKIIIEGYLEGGAVNLSKNITRVKDEESIISQIKGRSWLYQYLDYIAEDSKKALDSMQEMNQEEE